MAKLQPKVLDDDVLIELRVPRRLYQLWLAVEKLRSSSDEATDSLIELLSDMLADKMYEDLDFLDGSFDVEDVREAWGLKPEIDS